MRLAPELAERLAARRRRVRAGERRAAVLMPIVDGADGPALIFTLRSQTVSTHRGQVSFPGGRMDLGDRDLVHTALREAHEEVALPAADVRVLGALDDIPTVSGGTMVTPVVGVVRGAPRLQPSPAEVARIFTISLVALQDRAGWTTRPLRWEGRDWPMFYFDHDGETLWGMSAYATLQLLSFLPGGAPFPLPSPYDE